MRSALIGLLLLATAGCITQPSLQPLFTGGDSETVPGIEGTWVQEGDGDEPMFMTLRPLEGSEYEMTLAGDGKARRGTLAVRFGRIEGDLYWDLTARPLDDEDALWGLHRLPIHSFARVRWQGAQLEVAFLDPGWMKGAIEEGGLDIAHATIDRDRILTASTEDLQQLITDHAQDADFFGNPFVFHRPAAE
jgi:hypothetical protein